MSDRWEQLKRERLAQLVNGDPPLHQAPDAECCCEVSPPEFGGRIPDRECPLHGEHQAPDADERVGAIVGALAEDLHVLTVTQNPDHGLFWHCKGSGPCWEFAETFAPTVAQLMAQAAEEAVAERLAGVEAGIRSDLASWINLGDAKPPFAMHSAHWLVQRTYETCAGIVRRAALHPKETDR